jgi:hypothetical protein
MGSFGVRGSGSHGRKDVVSEHTVRLDRLAEASVARWNVILTSSSGGVINGEDGATRQEMLWVQRN